MRDDIWAVITPWVTQEQADAVRHLRRAVINDGFRLAPDADLLVAQDLPWWKHNPDALAFKGDKYSSGSLPGVSPVRHDGNICSGTDSGSVGIYMAIERGAKTVLLLGFHMHEKHGFKPHQKPLRNPKQETLNRWIAHYESLAKRMRGKVDIINCTPGSALKCFPMLDLAVSREWATTAAAESALATPSG